MRPNLSIQTLLTALSSCYYALQAARGGHQNVIELLVKYGADVNDRTGRHEDGQSVLSLVVENHGSDHPLAQYLRDLGAVEFDEEL